MKLSALWLLGLAVVALAIFGWYERGQGQLAALAVERAKALAQQADSLRGAMVAHQVQFAQDSAKQALAASQANQRWLATKSHADALEGRLRADTGVSVNRDTALAVIAAKDSALDAAHGVIQTDSAGIRDREAKIAFWRDTVVVQLTKARDDAQSQLGEALKKTNRRMHFPCASAGGTANNKGFGLGLTLGVCYSL